MAKKKFWITCRVVERKSGRVFQPKTTHDISADNETAALAEIRRKLNYVTGDRGVEVEFFSTVER
ncbi:MAG: hypothetical protein HOA30_04315 [Rhodospirillaceae bacterium]|nr:hypothetical protein [Rhodospirillaceae bacterium]MBT5191137.1 hypothetical protein [Rhodospirillaceae bacterium]MBT5877571.1 hypothetical protein [Rhodospirillaceae bacterium]MBT6426540.1 hypothetical protein [Rhodospirillaceae bacterium]MBT6883267.1 hypothetical protein [Rhodospirillaceae bacterium]